MFNSDRNDLWLYLLILTDSNACRRGLGAAQWNSDSETGHFHCVGVVMWQMYKPADFHLSGLSAAFTAAGTWEVSESRSSSARLIHLHPFNVDSDCFYLQSAAIKTFFFTDAEYWNNKEKGKVANIRKSERDEQNLIRSSVTWFHFKLSQQNVNEINRSWTVTLLFY